MLSVGAKFFHTGKEKDLRTDMTKLIVTFSIFGTRPGRSITSNNEFLKSNGLCGLLL